MLVSSPEPPQIARINQISLMTRTTWFGLLAYLAFVGVTLLGVQDADFFVPSRQTTLPLVNVDIPTRSFFLVAPVIGLALYTYLHLQLLKLWEVLAPPLGPRIGRDRLGDLIYPWLISDFGLWLRGDGAARDRPLTWVALTVTVMLPFTPMKALVRQLLQPLLSRLEAPGQLLAAICYSRKLSFGVELH